MFTRLTVLLLVAFLLKLFDYLLGTFLCYFVPTSVDIKVDAPAKPGFVRFDDLDFNSFILFYYI